MDPAPILVATDFSADADHALEVARQTAERFDAPILLLHVDERAGVAPASPAVQARRDGARAALDRTQRILEGYEVRSEVLLRPGDPATQILRVADARQVAMIVLATHGWTSVSSLLLGSVADRVVRRAAQPVLLVRHPARVVRGLLPGPQGNGGSE